MASDRSGATDDDEYYEVDDLEEIHNSIVNNDINQLQEACEAGADVNEKFTDDIDPQHAGMTALALASALNRLPHVKMLLQYGAEVNATFANLQTTALMTSSFHGHIDIVRTLLDHGASAKTVDTQGSTALGYAFGGSRSLDVVRMLLSAGVDVNQKNMLGMNALLLVSGYGNDQLVKLVLQSGADPNSTNDFGHSALHLAVVGKRSQVAGLTANRGSTSLYGLNRRDIDQSLKEWVSSHRDMLGGRRPEDTQLDTVGKLMMDLGSKLDESDDVPQDDQEAMKRRINAVCRYRDDRLQKNRDSKKPGVVDTFLSCGGKRGKKARKSVEDSTSNVPLNRPAENRRISPDVDRDVAALSDRCARIMRDILDAGCPVDKVESTFGMTALDMAILMGDLESTAQLLAAGADPDHLHKLFALSDLYRCTVLTPNKKTTRELLDIDDKLDVNMPYTAFNITHVSNEPQSDPTTEDGLTPVAAAVKGNSGESAEIIRMLIKHGADVNKIGPAGRSALGEACRSNNVKMVQTLVSQGANVEQQNPFFKNATPVVIAVICRNRDVVQFLIQKGAKLDKPLTDGRTSLIKAMENNDMNMIDDILGADKEQNFTDRSAFLYSMVELYNRDDRDIEKILNLITEKTRSHEQEDRERERALKPPVIVSTTSAVPPQPAKPVAAVSTNRPQQPRAVPAPQFESEDEEEEEEGSSEEEEDDDDGPPQHVQVPPKQAAAQQRVQEPPRQKQPQPVVQQPKQQQPKQQQIKPQNKPPPPPQQLSEDESEEEEDEEEDEEEEEEEEDEVPPPPVRKQEVPQVKPVKTETRVVTQMVTSAPRAAPPPKVVTQTSQPPPPLPTTAPPIGSSEDEEESEEEEESEDDEPPPPPPTTMTQMVRVPGKAVAKTSTTTQVLKSGGTNSTVVTRTVVTKTITSGVRTVAGPPTARAQIEEMEDGSDEEEESEEESEDDENENARVQVKAAPRPAVSVNSKRHVASSAETDI